MENQDQAQPDVSVETNQETVQLDVTGLPTLQRVEERYLTLVLQKTGGNKVQAAKLLGVSVKTIYNKLNSYAEPKPQV